MSRSALIAFKNAGCKYGRRSVVEGVSFDLFPGEIILLVGPNAAGKSTLLKIAAGLIGPQTGEVSRRREIRIGYLAHDSFIYSDLSAFDNLKFWAGFHGDRSSENDLLQVLRRVQLERSAWEKAGGFSRGMVQRLSLARVLLLNPEVVLLDEPGTGLDAESKKILFREVMQARDGGTGIIWVSHDLQADSGKADAVLALEDGKQVFWGPVNEFLTVRDDA
ncbi:MAG: ABC transporter ATP-binding protein [Thermodesulfobacteriota bacterium]